VNESTTTLPHSPGLALRAALGEADWAVLTYLDLTGRVPGAPPSTARQVSNFLGVPYAAASASLARLRDHGLVTVEPSRTYHVTAIPA
jgi:hypothetical protein